METIITYILQLADKYPVIGTIVFVAGGIYVTLTAIRGLLTLIVKATPTKKDDAVIATVFAFLDKWGWGFGKLADYYETHSKKEEKK